MAEISKTQIDRLGERLKKGVVNEPDLRLLDEYRRSFTEAYETVVGRVGREVGLEPTGRPAKSTSSISEKLQRESIRLTQIQDIAGCRLVVADTAEQDWVVQTLSAIFEEVSIVDRRRNPSHGYRAVHVVARLSNRLVEIQIRSSLQHLWAELSEKLADTIDPALKYGGGDQSILRTLAQSSILVAREEQQESELAIVEAGLARLLNRAQLTDDVRQQIRKVKGEVAAALNNQMQIKTETFKFLQDAITIYQSTPGKMMLFLIEYDRNLGEIVSFKAFDDGAQEDAAESRLQLELELNRRGKNHEVVLLQAVSEEAMRRTHRRYFENLAQLVETP